MRIELTRRKKTPRTVLSNHVDRAKCHDLYDDSDAELQNWCEAGRLIKFQMGIVLHDTCIFVRCGYGLDLWYTGFQLRCTLNRTVRNNCSTDNRTAPHRTIVAHRVIWKVEKVHRGAVLQVKRHENETTIVLKPTTTENTKRRVCSVRYRYSRYRCGCRTELTEVSGTGIDVVPN